MPFPVFPATLRRTALAALLSLGSLTLAHAQGPGNTGPALPGAAAVPLDGGASLLLVAGVGLGLRRLRRGRR